MSERKRQKIDVQKTQDASQLGQIIKEDLLSDSEKYDIENYDPLDSIDKKEILTPKNKTEVITIRLTPKENDRISHLADENGLTKSAFIRMMLKRVLKTEY